jgi:hypothetical protein
MKKFVFISLSERKNPLHQRCVDLPEGCKNLFDALYPQPSKPPSKLLPRPNWGYPQVSRKWVNIPEQVTVRQLAALLNRPTYRLLEELMKFWVFANEETTLARQDTARVARRLGFWPNFQPPEIKPEHGGGMKVLSVILTIWRALSHWFKGRCRR